MGKRSRDTNLDYVPREIEITSSGELRPVRACQFVRFTFQDMTDYAVSWKIKKCRRVERADQPPRERRITRGRI